MAIIQSPLATSNAAVAKAAMYAIFILACDNADNKAKLGFAGGCEGMRMGEWVDGLVRG